MGLAIPPAIEDEIEKFNRSGAIPNERMVHQALASARNAFSDPGEEDNLGAWSEVLVFALVGDCRRSSPWGTYFGPISSGKGADGTTCYFPDIHEATPEVINHWEWRARTITHPALKSRYADLVWDLSRAIAKKNPKPDMARLAIDAYLASIHDNLRTDIHSKFRAAVRALDNAIMITDGVRIDAARKTLLDLHRQALASGDGLWWIAFDRLIEEKRAGLTDRERDELLTNLEGVVKRCSITSDPKAFNPHFTENTANRLIKYYNRVGRPSDARRLHTIIGQSFEHFASLGDAMLAASVLQTASNAFHSAYLKEEARRVRVVMEQKIAKSHEQLKPVG